MPAAADLEQYREPEQQTTGPAKGYAPPMQDQQWHAVPDRDKDGQPMGDRYTVYSDDERIVCQTNGTWSTGPRDEERKPVVATIAAAPTMRAALVQVEEHLRKLIQADPYAGKSGMKSEHYTAYACVKIALGDTNPDTIE